MCQTNATRHELEVSGTFNVRDAGGMGTSDGGTVRSGVLYRSGDLGRLTPEGADRLRSLGVGLIVDLRTTREIERHGRFPFERHGIRYRHHSLVESRSVEPESMPAELPPDIRIQLMRRIAETGAEGLRDVFDLLGAEGTPPALVHCVAGKDRTGTVIGLLQALVGAPDEEVAADFALSEAALAALRTDSSGRHEELARWLATLPPQILEAKPADMLAFLAWIRERHGSVEELVRSIGVSAGTVTALRARLVESPLPA
jgi:protein tyrosine/serine phosphatase